MVLVGSLSQPINSDEWWLYLNNLYDYKLASFDNLCNSSLYSRTVRVICEELRLEIEFTRACQVFHRDSAFHISSKVRYYRI